MPRPAPPRPFSITLWSPHLASRGLAECPRIVFFSLLSRLCCTTPHFLPGRLSPRLLPPVPQRRGPSCWRRCTSWLGGQPGPARASQADCNYVNPILWGRAAVTRPTAALPLCIYISLQKSHKTGQGERRGHRRCHRSCQGRLAPAPQRPPPPKLHPPTPPTLRRTAAHSRPLALLPA